MPTPLELVDALQAMLPDAIVVGGSLSHEEMPSGEGDLQQRRRKLTDGVLVDALTRLGCTTRAPTKLPTGARAWPTGVVGSITNKHSVVLATVAKASKVQAVGIDLELADGPALPRHLVSPEATPPGVDEEVGTLLAFSAKEALYKALLRPGIGFLDLPLAWRRISGDSWRASSSGAKDFDVHVRQVGDWVIAAASARPL